MTVTHIVRAVLPALTIIRIAFLVRGNEPHATVGMPLGVQPCDLVYTHTTATHGMELGPTSLIANSSHRMLVAQHATRIRTVRRGLTYGAGPARVGTRSYN